MPADSLETAFAASPFAASGRCAGLIRLAGAEVVATPVESISARRTNPSLALKQAAHSRAGAHG